MRGTIHLDDFTPEGGFTIDGERLPTRAEAVEYLLELGYYDAAEAERLCDVLEREYASRVVRALEEAA